jgi:hypothetical protein
MHLLNIIDHKPLKKKICYIHVAKCGGTSVIASIKKQYPLADRILKGKFFVNLNASASLKGSELLGENLWAYREKILIYFLSIRANRFVAGHFPVSDLAMNYFKDDWNFITILRHPVDRWFSHYFFNRYKQAEHFKTDLSFEEYIDSDDGKSLGSFYHRLFYGSAYDHNNVSPEESYAKVTGNIDKLACVGLTEHLDIFCRDFNKYFGRKLNIGTRNKNPLPKKARSKLITDAICEQVERICEPDLKIYKYVLEKIHSK